MVLACAVGLLQRHMKRMEQHHMILQAKEGRNSEDLFGGRQTKAVES